MATSTYISLFSGAGGLDLSIGLAMPKARCVCFVEREIPAAAILAARMQDGSLHEAPIWSDIRSFDGRRWRGFVDGIIGGFPCFAPGTMVLSRAGYRPIESLAIGDEVLTHLGRWRRIYKVMHREGAQIRTVRGMGMPDIRTTDEHPFYVRKREPRKWVAGEERWHPRTFTEPEWVHAWELGSDSYVGQVLPPQDTNSEHSSDYWWLVGRYLADGWRVARKGRKSGRVVICCAEKEAEELANRITRAGYVASRCAERAVVKFHITRGDFYDFLEPFGKLAHGKTLPAFALGLDAERSKALIQGWLSGDGYRYKDRWSGATVSRALALSMALLAQRAFGVVASVHVYKRKPIVSIEGRSCRQRNGYAVHINDRNRSSFIGGDYGWKLVRSSKPDGISDVYNISVEGDESYVADGAIVHNCTDLSVAGKQAGIHGAASGLWFEYLRIIREVQPRWVFIENVPGVLAFPAGGIVLKGLAESGLNAEWGTLRASDVGAPHRRERAFILAYRVSSERGQNNEPWRENGRRPEDTGRPWGDSFVMADAQERGFGGVREPSGRDGFTDGGHAALADAIGERLEEWGKQRRNDESQQPAAERDCLPLFPPGPGDTDAWRRILAERPDLAPAVESGVRMLADGASAVVDEHRVDQLRMIGNSVCPLQAAVALRILWKRAGLSICQEN